MQTFMLMHQKILTTDGLKYSIQKDVDEADEKIKKMHKTQLEIKVNKMN